MKPLYMTCSLSGAVDKSTNQVSVFNIIEQLTLKVAGDLVVGVPPFQIHMVAAWSRTPDDLPTDCFDAEIDLKRPEDPKPKMLYQSSLKFEKPNHRFMVDALIMPRPNTHSGIIRFECRVRKQGTKKWLRQSYEIPLTVVHHSEAAQSSAKTKTKTRARKK